MSARVPTVTRYGRNPIEDLELANKAYVDSLSAAVTIVQADGIVGNFTLTGTFTRIDGSTSGSMTIVAPNTGRRGVIIGIASPRITAVTGEIRINDDGTGDTAGSSQIFFNPTPMTLIKETTCDGQTITLEARFTGAGAGRIEAAFMCRIMVISF